LRVHHCQLRVGLANLIVRAEHPPAQEDRRRGDDRERETLGLGDMKFDAEGLIPAVVQQHDTGEVLMVAWMNAESLARTCETRKTWFWSRSRQKYWMKGEESGNTQEVRELRYDCDADTLLVLVDAAGPACHTGESTCFYRSLCGEGGAARAAVTAGAGGAAAPRIGDVLDEPRLELPG